MICVITEGSYSDYMIRLVLAEHPPKEIVEACRAEHHCLEVERWKAQKEAETAYCERTGTKGGSPYYKWWEEFKQSPECAAVPPYPHLEDSFARAGYEVLEWDEENL